MPTQFIAEVSSNHHQSLERCLEFVEAAARIGCDAVKFQLFRIDQLFSPEILSRSEKHRQRKQWELPLEFLPPLAKHCEELGIAFSCTPFHLQAVSDLEPYVAFYKIASYELLWHDLIRSCSATGKPLILSTGMATMVEVQEAVAAARDAGCRDLTLLQCISGYPTPVEQCNLAAIESLRQATGCPVGWSDHSVSAAVLHRAVQRWEATVVEFHLDLEGEGEEFGSGHCWLPQQIGPVIEAIRLGEQADGSGLKQPAAVELPDRDWRADPSDGLRPLQSIRSAWHP